SLVHTLLRLLQDTEDAQAFASVRARCRAARHALKEMLAFKLERFDRLDCNRLGSDLAELHDAIAPGDRLPVDQELAFPRLAIVENCHAAFADHNELLLLDRVQPRHKHMRLGSIRKRQMRGGDIGHGLMKNVAAYRMDMIRLLASQ